MSDSEIFLGSLTQNVVQRNGTQRTGRVVKLLFT